MHSFYKIRYICHLIHNLKLDCTSHSDIQSHDRPKQLSSMKHLVDYICSR